MTYKLLFLDIDGTILTPDDQIQESTKRAVAAVQKQGVEVFLATGRPLHEISHIGKELNVQSFIGYNGAFTVYRGREILKEPMNPDIVQNFVHTAKHHGHELVMYTREKNVLSSFDSPAMKNFIQKFHLQKNELFSYDIIDQVLGMTILNLADRDVSLYEKDDLIYLSQVNIEGLAQCYDVIREKVNKGKAVKAILNYLGVPKESAIAFGDAMNDKEMLSIVGEGFAMGNADPNLLPYAKHQTTDVTNSGVYHGLKKLGLVE
ncbi:MAG: Cof-type HAD-IIB family hydrolase [Bacillaceae bacterium]|uniref:HAD family hydrolase n=1 Tax=Aeribacillus composti TaxID=1868734 RepID=A0ABY9WBK4_9BACI|nr:MULTISPECIES: HAD family hydrolase [Aeribacillus]REJ12168.1 MAG: Cof-type HAD-IIB family hydrolase [Bacillaceae bacterium]KZM53368.1 hydrolase [Aeribacillus pallidus]MDR9793104.1 HAD family hydrolase [Aeribacillus pallidus]MED0649329.1 HAD family hydrolase [Aeribacillus composti]MED4486929.1 HAD family hydrolase [Aeribacillus pallidus]